MNLIKNFITTITIATFLLLSTPAPYAVAQETPEDETTIETVEEQVNTLLKQLLSLLEERFQALTKQTSSEEAEGKEDTATSTITARDDNEDEEEASSSRQPTLEQAGSRGETTGSKSSSESSDSGRRGGSRGLSGAGTTVIADRTPPVISSVQKTGNFSQATISWTTDEPATSRVNYGRIDGPIDSFSSSDALVTSHSLLLAPGYSCDGDPNTFNFEVMSVDASGNTATSTDEDGQFSIGGSCTGGGR